MQPPLTPRESRAVPMVIPLTSIDDVRKIRGIQRTKEKRLTRSLPFTKAPELPTAIPTNKG
jgi:hypothetical protein